MHIVSDFVRSCTTIIATGGPITGFLLILLESFIPALPLGVFVALNINAFGFFFGIIISWSATCLGCFLSYLLLYYLSNNFIDKFLNSNLRKKVRLGTSKFKKIPLQNLVLIITLPFTPAFLVNILAGVSRIKTDKFLISIIIGKLFMVIFWGYIGKSFIESMTDIKTIIFIALTLVVSYIISKVIGKKMNIE